MEKPKEIKHKPGDRIKRQEATRARRWEIKDKILNKLSEYIKEDVADNQANGERAFKRTDEWIQAWRKREPQISSMIMQEAISVRLDMKKKFLENKDETVRLEERQI